MKQVHPAQNTDREIRLRIWEANGERVIGPFPEKVQSEQRGRLKNAKGWKFLEGGSEEEESEGETETQLAACRRTWKEE